MQDRLECRSPTCLMKFIGQDGIDLSVQFGTSFKLEVYRDGRTCKVVFIDNNPPDYLPSTMLGSIRISEDSLQAFLESIKQDSNITVVKMLGFPLPDTSGLDATGDVL